jgi:hypothetical protein
MNINRILYVIIIDPHHLICTKHDDSNALFIVLHLKNNTSRLLSLIYQDVCLVYCHLKTPVTSLCHTLILVTLFIVTVTITMVCFTHSFCYRSKLNWGNKWEREMVLFIHSFLLRSMNRTIEGERKKRWVLTAYVNHERKRGKIGSCCY